MSASVAPKDSRTKAKRDGTFRQRSSSARVSAPGATNDLETTGDSSRALAGGDFSAATFERHAKMLGDPRLSQPANAQQRATITRQLQRTYGNRYVQRLVSHIQKTRDIALQTKLTVGPAGDKYEQEADRVANEVVGMIKSAGEPSVQRQEEEEELQAKPIQRQEEEEELQAKLIQRQEEEEELQAKPIQRQEEEEELQAKLIQRQVPLEGGYVGPDAESAIESSRGRGQALPDNVRGSMEEAMGADFSGVRVHNDTESNALNETMSARAFTTGQDIFFRQGEYNPDSSAGKEVLAHELTHVVQQNGAAVQRDIESHPKAVPLSFISQVSNSQQKGLVARAIGPLVETTLAAIEAADEVGTLGYTTPPKDYQAPAMKTLKPKKQRWSRPSRQWVVEPELKKGADPGEVKGYYPKKGFEYTGDEGGKGVFSYIGDGVYAKIKAAEQEHIDDAKHAYKISLKEAEDVLKNHVIDKTFKAGTENEVKDKVHKAITDNLTHADLGNDQGYWADIYIDLGNKTLSGRDKRDWHTFDTVRSEETDTAGAPVIVNEVFESGTINIGTVASKVIIKYPI